jgi:pimeloyl-ACP methyl ester carboxylesterase
VLAFCALLPLTACRPPVGVVRLDLRQVQEQLKGDVLNAGRPSAASRTELQRRGLSERYADDPVAVLAALHTALVADPHDADLLFALTELSFDHALHGGERSYYLATVVYAWEYLFGDGASERLDVFDPRGRLCADLYNAALVRAFESTRRGDVALRSGPRKLPFGTLDVSFDPQSVVWGEWRLINFESASDLGVWGLRNRYRTWGIGAALNAATMAADPGRDADGLVLPKIRVPVTMLLRPARGAGTDASAVWTARLEVHAVTNEPTAMIGARKVPLEYEPTSALAEALSEADPWRMEKQAFFHGAIVGAEASHRMGALEPLNPDKIPVVLVHGTASSLARWAEMVNDLMNDPDVRRRFQFWVFTYDTGNPILYSAMQLRESLDTIVRSADATGQHGCLRDIVLIGHSQGGLLSKLAVVESSDRFWRLVSTQPFDKVPLSAHNRDLLRRTVFVSPSPFVTAVIFIATPHRGSYLARGFVRRLLHGLVELSGDLPGLGGELFGGSAATHARLRQLPTSVDDMAPGSPFVEVLSSLPIVPGVSAHSIIPVLGDGPLADERDGVVAYASAHMEPVDSELVVRHSGHSTQGNPQTIEEVRRILLEHAAAAAGCGDSGTPAPQPQ